MSGQISASLAAMQRTIDDYDSMAKRELIKVKQEKAQMCGFSTTLGEYRGLTTVSSYHRRVAKFRSDYNELRIEFERWKAQVSLP